MTTVASHQIVSKVQPQSKADIILERMEGLWKKSIILAVFFSFLGAFGWYTLIEKVLWASAPTLKARAAEQDERIARLEREIQVMRGALSEINSNAQGLAEIMKTLEKTRAPARAPSRAAPAQAAATPQALGAGQLAAKSEDSVRRGEDL